MKDLLALKLYTRVARLGSFSAAARECGLSQSQASRIIAELETGLGAQLLMRSTRAVVPTEAGAEFLARIETILLSLEEAELAVREGGELRGQLRVGMPASLGVRMVLPRLSAFTRQHPDLRIQIILEDKLQDMVREAVDVGIRVGPLPAAIGTSKLIARIQRVIVAAPTYLAEHGAPTTPAALSDHRIVGGPAAQHPTAWQFERDGETVLIELEPHMSVNDTIGAVAAAAGGLGITSTTLWACQDELTRGTLVLLLADWQVPEIPVHAYFPMGRSTRRAARAFIDFLVAEIQPQPVAITV